MSEIRETSVPASKPETSRLLSASEISAIKQEKIAYGRKMNSYTNASGTVTTTFISPNLDKLSEDEAEEITSFLKARENGEGYRYEPLIVNALFKQFEIAEIFGLSKESMKVDFRLETERKNSQKLIDNWGTLDLLSLDYNVRLFRRQGITDEELVIELAGHIFHEAIHDSADGNISEALLGGKNSLGEVTPVTGQMAYYLIEGHNGSTVYDKNRYELGLKKIKSGDVQTGDHDIATYVASNIIYQALVEAYPGIEKDQIPDQIKASQDIVSKMSPEERSKLIPTLKEAIVKSADKDEFKKIVKQVNEVK